MHTALRRAPDRPLLVNGRDVMLEVRREREKVFDFVRGVQQGRIVGSDGKRFETVVNIGIGGSDLGPVMAVDALARYRLPGIRVSLRVECGRLSDG